MFWLAVQSTTTDNGGKTCVSLHDDGVNKSFDPLFVGYQFWDECKTLQLLSHVCSLANDGKCRPTVSAPRDPMVVK